MLNPNLLERLQNYLHQNLGRLYKPFTIGKLIWQFERLIDNDILNLAYN